MSKLIALISLSCLLAACGGGGGGGGDVGVGTTPAPVLSDTPSMPEPPTQTTEPMPPVAADAVNLTTSAFNQGGNGMDALVKFTGAPNLTVTGNLNRMWLSAAAAGGSVTVSGGENSLVFLPGTTTTVTVTGSANTLYLPLGSLIQLTGSGLASTSVKHYAP